MEHSYNVKIAAEYGIAEAVLLKNLYFWCEKNKANDKNFHDGHYWTFNSVKAFVELFPELSKAKISSALKKLETESLIITGNYNTNSYNHTTWYSITNKGIRLLNNDNSINENRNSISENKKSNVSKSEISITDINTDNKPYINTDNNNNEITEDKINEHHKSDCPGIVSNFPEFDDLMVPVSTPKKKTTKKKSTKKNNLLPDDFYKPIYDKYREIFFSHCSGIPNCGKYKDFTDKCVERYRNMGLSDSQIQCYIITAINNAASDSYCLKNRLPFAMIVSEAVMPRLVNTTTAADKSEFGVDFESQNYDEGF